MVVKVSVLRWLAHNDGFYGNKGRYMMTWQ